jgi:GAF domain-containing protein
MSEHPPRPVVWGGRDGDPRSVCGCIAGRLPRSDQFRMEARMSTPLSSGPPASYSSPPKIAGPSYVDGMERLLHAVQELSLTRSLPEIQRLVRTSARELTGCDGATFVLRDNDKCYYAEEDAIAPLWKGSRFPIQTCISGWAMLNCAAAVIPDIYRDQRIPHNLYRPTFVKSLVMVPIRRLEPIGAIGNYWATYHQPSEQEVRLLQALADSTSIAMENVQVYSELEQRVRDRTAALEEANEEIRRLSVTDELTGLNNRRGFYLLAEQKLRGAHRLGHN